MNRSNTKKIWTVVLVESGIPTDVKVFRDVASAKKFENSLRENINLEDDEVGLFDVVI
jgi:hypothetical protein